MDAEVDQTVPGRQRVAMYSSALRLLAFLTGHKGHPTAAEIFEALNRVHPRSSRATTYNNLRDLVQAGLVREVAVEEPCRCSFDANGMPHHHFICDHYARQS